jgi:discs large protein 5
LLDKIAIVTQFVLAKIIVQCLTMPFTFGSQKKTLSYQIETLKIEIASALHDRDKALKECNDLREKFGGYTSKEESNRESLKSRLEYDIYNRER